MKLITLFAITCFSIIGVLQAQTSGCTGTASISVTIEDCTPTTNLAGIKSFEVSPNPANEWISISFQTTENIPGSLRLLDASGKNFYQQNMEIAGETTKIIKIDHLPAGIYWVVFQTTYGVSSRKVVIE